MEIKGQISDIIFQNEINSYTIANMETDGEDVIVVGYLPFINVGDNLKLNGNMVLHKDYGEQFKIDSFEKIMPETLDELEKYLSNGSIRGIGPSTARKIVELFGKDTVNVFRFSPEKLMGIKGISKEKSMEMSQDFVENWDLWQIVGFLERFGIGIASAKKVYETLGADAISDIESNPYILVDIVRNIDFNKVDKAAIGLGVEFNSQKRIKSGIKYSLVKISYNGHCCTAKSNLIFFARELLGVSNDEIEESIISLNLKDEIVIEKRENEEWIYLSDFYKAELNVAERIVSLNNNKIVEKVSDFNKKLEMAQMNSNIELSEKQKEAIKAMNKNNVTIITGGPGTGKTTIIKTIIEIYKLDDKKVVLCAPTGRAAKRMTEATGEEAKTLHRLLEIGKLENEDNKYNTNYEVAPIDADLIVIDEVSMVDVFLMNYLVKAIFKGTKLVLVGDMDQLPSVGPGAVLKDIINSEKIMTIKLNKIFRQAAQSKIVLNAHRVNDGETFINKDTCDSKEELKQDFFYINENNQDLIISQVVSLCQGRLKNYGDYDFFDNIQVLTPTKKGALGTRELNKTLQNALNPELNNKKEKKTGEIIFRQGDRVMQIKNNYNIYWERKDRISQKSENGSGVFNGEFGIINSIDEDSKQIKVTFDDDKVVWYAYSDLDQLEHAYAITIHKSQGSEFDVVIIVIPRSSPNLLTRNLLYTSITRARKLLVVIGDDNIIQFMIRNEDNKKRNTGLEYKLRQL